MNRNILTVPSVHTFDINPFQELENLMNNWGGAFDFNSALKDIPTPSKYPKYELLKDKNDSKHNRIRICVAGMNPDNIEISTLKNKISIKYEPEKSVNSEQVNKEDYEVIETENCRDIRKKQPEFETVVSYISNRSFTQYFSAPESYLVKVNSAEVKDGILTIDTIMELPEDMKETKIPIKITSDK